MGGVLASSRTGRRQRVLVRVTMAAPTSHGGVMQALSANLAVNSGDLQLVAGPEDKHVSKEADT